VLDVVREPGGRARAHVQRHLRRHRARERPGVRAGRARRRGDRPPARCAAAAAAVPGLASQPRRGLGRRPPASFDLRAMTLRIAHPDDAEAVAAIYGPVVEHTAISFELQPPSADEMRTRILATLRHLPWL